MKLQLRLVVAVLLATPAAAFAAPGMITTSVNLRAGPSVEFPVVNRISKGVLVEVHGCIRDALWCDVSTERERGWVAAQYLDYLYGDRYVYLPSYVNLADVPPASFVLTSYWSSFYVGRPWYRRHVWWNRHWNTQTRVATQTLAAQPATAPAPAVNGMTPVGAAKPPASTAKLQAGTAKPPAGIAMGRGPIGVPAVASGQGMGMQAMRAPDRRMTPAAGGQDRFSGMRPSMTSGATGPGNAIRGGSVPMAAHAQFGGSRGGLGGGSLGGGSLPHGPMGGAPQAGGAMHNGGGGGGRDSGGGHRRH